MDIALLAARLLLAGILLVAGLAKLVDHVGSRQAVIAFGVPTPLAAPLAVLLPLVELALAVALIQLSTAWWGALGALVLLLLFILGIGANLARGKKPDCHCFGQLHSAPAGRKTLVRNGVLAAVAALLVWRGWGGNAGPSAIAWIGALSTAQLLGLIGTLVVLGFVVAQWWFLLHLMRQNGRLLVRLEQLEGNLASSGAAPSHNGTPAQPTEGPQVGTYAPSFSLKGIYGETVTLDSLLTSGKPLTLLFTDPACGPCNALLPEVGHWQKEHAEKLSIALISRGTPEENKAKASEYGLTKVLLQNDWEVSTSYGILGTPSTVVVSPDGIIGSGVASGSEAIESLVRQTVGTPAWVQLPPGAPGSAAASNGNGGPCPKCGKQHLAEAVPAMPVTLEVGEPAPEMKLEDLSGKVVRLKEDFEGENTLMLFWNPGCGFCQQMLPDLKKWEEVQPEGSPKLLIISAGTKEANAAMGLSSPVVLDQNFAVGRAFGASGTPSAVLVDAEGNVASEGGMGAPAVLELAQARKGVPNR